MLLHCRRPSQLRYIVACDDKLVWTPERQGLTIHQREFLTQFSARHWQSVRRVAVLDSSETAVSTGLADVKVLTSGVRDLSLSH